MNISDTIGFLGGHGTTDQRLDALVSQLELYRNNLVNQLRIQPTVFHADPSKDTDVVAGAKTGDVAFWTDDAGVQHFKILGT